MTKQDQVNSVPFCIEKEPLRRAAAGAAAPPPPGDSASNPDPFASPRHELGGWVRWVSRGWVTPTEPRHCPCPDAAFSVRSLSTSVAHNRIDGTHSAVGKRGGSRACARPKGPQGAGRRAPARHEPAAGAALRATPQDSAAQAAKSPMTTQHVCETNKKENECNISLATLPTASPC